MTSPIVQLPQVQLGNVGQDISSAGGGLIAGLLKQRQLAQQQALTAALTNSTVGRNQAEQAEAEARTKQLIPAQTGFYNQRAETMSQQPQMKNDALDATLAKSGIVKSTGPYKPGDPTPPEVDPQGQFIGLDPSGRGMFAVSPSPTAKLQARTKEDVAAIGASAHGKLNFSQLTRRFDNLIKPHNDAADAYARVVDQLNSGSSLTPTDVLGSLAQLAVPGNARAVGQMLTAFKSGGPLSGPMTAYENVFNKVFKVLHTTGNTLTPEAMQEVKKAADALISHHKQMHDQIKQTILNDAQTNGVTMSDTDLEDKSPFDSPEFGNQSQPQGGGGLNDLISQYKQARGIK